MGSDSETHDREESSTTTSQSSSVASKSSKSTDSKSTDKERDKHSSLAIELVETEMSYVDFLRTLNDTFYVRLRSLLKLKKPLISENQLKVLFMNFEAIYGMSIRLRDDLLKLRYEGAEAVVEGGGKVLKNYIPFMRLYVHFVGKYPQSMKLLESLQNNKRWCEFQTLGEMCCGRELSSLLIMPIQRVPRYVMILKELHKSASEKSREDIKEVYDQLEKTAHHINTQAKHMEARKRVVDMQEEMFSDQCRLVTPTRYHVFQGDLIKVHNKGRSIMRRKESYIFILFNDILIYASRSGSSYAKFKHALPLDKIEIRDDGEEPKKKFRAGEVGFYIKMSDESTAKSFLVICPDEKTRDEWTKQIRATSRNYLEDIETLEREPKTVEQIESQIRKHDDNESIPVPMMGKDMRRASAPANLGSTKSLLPLKYSQIDEDHEVTLSEFMDDGDEKSLASNSEISSLGSRSSSRLHSRTPSSSVVARASHALAPSPEKPPPPQSMPCISSDERPPSSYQPPSKTPGNSSQSKTPGKTPYAKTPQPKSRAKSVNDVSVVVQAVHASFSAQANAGSPRSPAAMHLNIPSRVRNRIQLYEQKAAKQEQAWRRSPLPRKTQTLPSPPALNGI